MRCSEIQKLLPQYADNELSQEQESDLNRHLAGCPACRAALEDYRFLHERSRQAEGVPAAPDIAAATMEKINALPDSGAAEAGRITLRRWLRPALAVAVAAVVLTLAVIQPWSPDAYSVLARADEAMGEVVSYHMIKTQTVNFHGRRQPEWYSSEVIRAENPPRMYSATTHNRGTWEWLGTDGDMYSRHTPPEEPYDYPYAQELVVIIPGVPNEDTSTWTLGQLTDLETLPDEIIDGVNCWHYRGEYDLEALSSSRMSLLGTTGMNPLQLGDLAKVTNSMDIWIGKDDYLLRLTRHEVRAPVLASSGETIGWNVSVTEAKYFDFNAPVNVEPPLDESGELLPDWKKLKVNVRETVTPNTPDI